jgi:spore germination protein GerM
MNRHVAIIRSAVLVAGFLVALAGCGPVTGDLGAVATTPPSAEPSLDNPRPDSTPGSSSVATGAPSGGPSAGPTTRPTKAPAATQSPSGATTVVRVYYFLGSFVDNAGLTPVLREVPETKAVGAAALTALLEGPNEAELSARPALYTTIPEATHFLGLRIERGIATVNLSREFELGGGAASVLGRLAQVVYTLTQFPTVSGVRFELDGEPVTVFSGEGVVLDEPVDRLDYTDQLPAIFLDRPAWRGVPNNPMRIAGMTDVFEAVFQVRLLDAGGRTLAEGPISATCGSGCWGTFDASIPYQVSSAGWGTLRVWVASAVDGSPESTTDYPVWLTP